MADGRGCRWRALLVGCVAMGACTTGSSAGEPSTSPSAPDPTVSSTAPATTVAATTTIAPLSTWVPDGYDDIELLTSVSEARPGDEIDVTVLCPFRDAVWEAYLQVDLLDETFEQQEVPWSEPDRFATSFVVPYWLEPGEIVIRGGCPSPAGPCDDTGDCPEFISDSTAPVILPLLPRGEPWDAWRPVVEPYIDPRPEPGSTLLGGALVEDAGEGWAALTASVGDTVTLTAVCSPAAEVSGGRFAVMPSRTRDTDRYQDDWDWSIDADPAEPGRYVIVNSDLLTAERALGDPLPWFVEVDVTEQRVTETGIEITAKVAITSSLVDQGDREFVFGALCEDVGSPFDPRSIDHDSASQIYLSIAG